MRKFLGSVPPVLAATPARLRRVGGCGSWRRGQHPGGQIKDATAVSGSGARRGRGLDQACGVSGTGVGSTTSSQPLA
jgi:hypothetical protein